MHGDAIMKIREFLFHFLSCRAWPTLVLQTYRNVRHFNEVQLIDFHWVWGVFRGSNIVRKGLHRWLVSWLATREVLCLLFPCAPVAHDGLSS